MLGTRVDRLPARRRRAEQRAAERPRPGQRDQPDIALDVDAERRFREALTVGEEVRRRVDRYEAADVRVGIEQALRGDARGPESTRRRLVIGERRPERRI